MGSSLTETTGIWRPATDLQKHYALVLLAKLPARNPTEFGSVRDAYLIALEGVTAFGLDQATKAILRGSLGHAFMPSPPELRLECERMMEPTREKLVTEQRMRWAEDDDSGSLPDAAARQRMNGLWLKVRPMFEQPKKGDPPKPKTDEERMADLLAHAADPIEVTDTLKRKLGFTNADGEDGHERTGKRDQRSTGSGLSGGEAEA